MNIFLIPYTWMRHFSVAFVCAGAGLVAWWIVLTISVIHPPWTVAWDGAVYLGALAAFSGGASVLAESSLRRDGVFRRAGRTLLAAFLCGVLAVIGYWIWHGAVGKVLFGDNASELADPTLVSLRYRLPAWAMVGMATAIGPILLRRFSGFFTHLGAGLAAGLAGGATWFVLGFPPFELTWDDLYLAGAGGALVFGGTFGLLAWGVPDNLYAGWVRVVSETRHGRRIPVDGKDGGARERYVGHFPRGLDLFLPAEEGVMELHVSFLVDRNQRYRMRGLTLQPTLVRRFLERIDLRYDARRPAPLETKLSSGDRVVLGPPNNPTVVEFLMLPREER